MSNSVFRIRKHLKGLQITRIFNLYGTLKNQLRVKYTKSILVFNIRPLYYCTWYIFNFGQMFPSSETQPKLNIYHSLWYSRLN